MDVGVMVGAIGMGAVSVAVGNTGARVAVGVAGAIVGVGDAGTRDAMAVGVGDAVGVAVNGTVVGVTVGMTVVAFIWHGKATCKLPVCESTPLPLTRDEYPACILFDNITFAAPSR